MQRAQRAAPVTCSLKAARYASSPFPFIISSLVAPPLLIRISAGTIHESIQAHCLVDLQETPSWHPSSKAFVYAVYLPRPPIFSMASLIARSMSCA